MPAQVEMIIDMRQPLVVLESPYAGRVRRNVKYARRCLRDSCLRGELPIAGHLLYTQIFNDKDPFQRGLGLAKHLGLLSHCQLVAVYTDWGVSPGMQESINRALARMLPIKYRQIGKR